MTCLCGVVGGLFDFRIMKFVLQNLCAPALLDANLLSHRLS